MISQNQISRCASMHVHMQSISAMVYVSGNHHVYYRTRVFEKPLHSPNNKKHPGSHGGVASAVMHAPLILYMYIYYTLLYYTLLYSTLLHSTLLYYTILYSTLLYSTILYSTLLYYTILYSTLLYYTILYYLGSKPSLGECRVAGHRCRWASGSCRQATS